MENEEMVIRIKKIIEEWGSFSINEVENAECPIYSKVDKDSEWMVESINFYDVMVTHYIHGVDVGSTNIDFKDINDNLLSEIDVIVQDYEAESIRTEKRIQD